MFKILNPKRAGTAGDSDGERDFSTNYGTKNIKALIEESQKEFDQLSTNEIDKRITQMQTSLASMKKAIRYPNAK